MIDKKTVTINFIAKILREQNPQKTEKQLGDFFINCLQNGMDSWEIHGFLVSGYAKEWKYNLKNGINIKNPL